MHVYHVGVGAPGRQEALELEFQEVVSHLVRILETELTSVRKSSTLSQSHLQLVL